MFKASSVVASVTQQSGQRVSQSRTEYTECLKVTSSDGTTAQRADDQRRSIDDISVPCQRLEHNRQLDTVARYLWGSDESRWNRVQYENCCRHGTTYRTQKISRIDKINTTTKLYRWDRTDVQVSSHNMIVLVDTNAKHCSTAYRLV